MKQTIIELWNGDIAPVERCGVYDAKAKHLMHQMAQNRDALRGELSDIQKEMLRKYLDSSEEYLLRMMELAFSEGFCLGSRLAAEALG